MKVWSVRYSRIGTLKPAQRHKVSTDILKMLLLDKVKNRTYRKIIVMADEGETGKLINGKSYLSECIRQFDIEVKYIEVDDDIRDSLLTAQSRQRMVNG